MYVTSYKVKIFQTVMAVIPIHNGNRHYPDRFSNKIKCTLTNPVIAPVLKRERPFRPWSVRVGFRYETTNKSLVHMYYVADLNYVNLISIKI